MIPLPSGLFRLNLDLSTVEMESLKELAGEWMDPNDRDSLEVEARAVFVVGLREEVSRRTKIRPPKTQLALPLEGGAK